MKQPNFFTIFYVALSCVVLGGLIGATTNMINGAVSPYYSEAVMYWDFQIFGLQAWHKGF